MKGLLIYLSLTLTLLAQKPQIQITGDITYQTYVKFVLQLSQELNTKTHHRVYIDSPGGVVDDAFNIIDFIKGMQLQGHSFTCIAYRAYSAAFSILQSCDHRVTTRKSSFMQHRAYKLYKGYIRFYTWYTSQIDRTQLDLCHRIKIPREQFRLDFINRERFITPDEAIRFGIVDRFEYDIEWLKN